MNESTAVLRSFAKTLQRLSGASTVSMFVPPGPGESDGPTLIHEGRLQPAAELADFQAARRFHETLAPKLEGEPGALLVAPSSPGDCRLLRLPALGSLLAIETAAGGPGSNHAHRRRADMADAFANSAAWVGLRFDGEPKWEVPAAVASEPLSGESGWGRLLALGAALAWHSQQAATGIPNDPTTGLPSRVEFQISLGRAMEQARATMKPLTLLFVNPDEFAEVNERFGREAGDAVVRDIANRLRASLRSSDLVSKYGGAVFATILMDTMRPEGRGVAEKLLPTLTEGAYLNGALRLGFSVGAAVYDPSDPAIGEPLALIRRADQALHAAKRSGGGRIVVWQRGEEIEELDSLDRLSGIFTANMAKDYRNMVLLWDTVTVIAGSDDFAGLATQVVERLYETLKPRRVALYRWSAAGELELVKGIGRPPAHDSGRVEKVTLDREQMALLDKARRLGQAAVAEGLEGHGSEKENAYAVPLIAGDDCLGCLYVDGRQDALALDASDLIFLRALTGQLAVAFDRSRLAEQERQRLRTELKELRHALQESRLLYCSPQMEQVIATVRRVAPTDATVLITGESGTGKELLARTIHELSPRRTQPLVVVDCGAIAATLIDSELFGHERGAYTGAQQRALGRLAEANGGTVLLDEIGELPLEVQSKLLRFVQEKQFTPVGGTRPRRVDVRVIAATNRDLAAEAAAGRFREDLYYRLNVVHLVVPPLRERPDDILYLANHWLEKYSVQYQKPVRRLSREAGHLLRQHPWLGNVRELQNRIMQAVILCERDELGATELTLRAGATSHPASLSSNGREPGGTCGPRDQPPPYREPLPVSLPKPQPPAASLPASDAGSAPPDLGTPNQAWDALRLAIGQQIDETLSLRNQGLPLGKWLNEDLVLEAYAAADGLFKGGAALLGIPETTFRRKVHKARATANAGLAVRSPGWLATRNIVAGVVRSLGDENGDLLLQARNLLLEEIRRRLPEDPKRGSVLAGVTLQTYRRWQAELLDG